MALFQPGQFLPFPVQQVIGYFQRKDPFDGRNGPFGNSQPDLSQIHEGQGFNRTDLSFSLTGWAGIIGAELNRRPDPLTGKFKEPEF